MINYVSSQTDILLTALHALINSKEVFYDISHRQIFGMRDMRNLSKHYYFIAEYKASVIEFLKNAGFVFSKVFNPRTDRGHPAADIAVVEGIASLPCQENIFIYVLLLPACDVEMVSKVMKIISTTFSSPGNSKYPDNENVVDLIWNTVSLIVKTHDVTLFSNKETAFRVSSEGVGGWGDIERKITHQTQG